MIFVQDTIAVAEHLRDASHQVFDGAPVAMIEAGFEELTQRVGSIET